MPVSTGARSVVDGRGLRFGWALTLAFAPQAAAEDLPVQGSVEELATEEDGGPDLLLAPGRKGREASSNCFSTASRSSSELRLPAMAADDSKQGGAVHPAAGLRGSCELLPQQWLEQAMVSAS